MFASPSRAERFLRQLDRLTENLGLNVEPVADLRQLQQHPPGSFGRAWADALDANGLEPFTTGPRRKQLHDGVHVLTGYGTDPVGEAEVQAFLLGAKLNLANLLLGLALARIVRKKGLEGRRNLRDRLRKAYWRGRYSCFDPDEWQPEQLWTLSLTEVRQLFRI